MDSMDIDSSHKAVCILEIVNGENEQVDYQLKIDEFKKIFDDYRDVLVAIISIAGEIRSGKSFMMTSLADYLKNPSQPWGNWEHEELTKVFDHRGGVDGHTNGIYVTRKPFMLKTKDEKEVAVFLMDTQGMFDTNSSANDNSVIFALSTLLSSVQLYNIRGLIKEDNIQHLKLFTDYTHCVANKKRDVSTSSQDMAVNHPFQGLLFLCRNWEQPDYAHGFEGGSEYLKKVMKVDNKENKLVRKRLTDSFSHVRCSLMPPPGKLISIRGIKDSTVVCFSDMDEDFISQVEDLAKYLFGKEHLVAKKLNGRELTGEDFINLAMDYVGILQSGEIPKVETLVKSNEKLEFLLRIKDIESNYKKSMQAKMGEIPLVPAEFIAFHVQCFNEAKDLFNEANILEDEVELQKWLTEMENNIGIICQSISKDNEAKITRIMMMIDKHIIYAGKVYYKSLETFAAGCWVEDIRKAKDHATEQANACFQARVNDIERQWFREDTSTTLQSTFESKQKQFETKNASRKRELETNMSQLLMQAIHKYQDRMEVELKRNQDMKRAHENSKLYAIGLFNDSNTGKDTKYKEGKELELKLKISEELKQYQQLYKEKMDGELAKLSRKAKKKYLQHFQRLDQYVTATELESSHVEAENVAMEVVNAVSYRGDDFVQKCKENVAKLIQFEKKHCISRNEVLKGKEAARLVRQRQYWEEQYKSKYTAFEDTYIVDAELQKIHAEAFNRAKAGLSYTETKHIEALKTNMEELEININESFQMVQQTNEQNQRLIYKKLLEFQILLEADYLEKMSEVTTKRYADINDLKKMHGSFIAAVIREVKPLIPYADIFDETINSSIEKLEAIFKNLKASETDWNGIFKKIINIANITLSSVLFVRGAVATTALASVVSNPAAAGVAMAVAVTVTVVKVAVDFYLNSVDEKIDVSELKSILYLKKLKLD